MILEIKLILKDITWQYLPYILQIYTSNLFQHFFKNSQVDRKCAKPYNQEDLLEVTTRFPSSGDESESCLTKVAVPKARQTFVRLSFF